MLNTYEQKSRLKLAATVVTILVVAGIVMLADHIKSDDSAATASIVQDSSSDSVQVPSAEVPSETPASTDTTSSPDSSTASSGYKDGTYTAASNYFVPNGKEKIQVSLTLQDGAITSVSIQNSEGDRDSALYQEEFATRYKSRVVGKKIDGLQISVVAGASDTTDGFNEAISKIASQARA